MRHLRPELWQPTTAEAKLEKVERDLPLICRYCYCLLPLSYSLDKACVINSSSLSRSVASAPNSSLHVKLPSFSLRTSPDRPQLPRPPLLVSQILPRQHHVSQCCWIQREGNDAQSVPL